MIPLSKSLQPAATAATPNMIIWNLTYLTRLVMALLKEQLKCGKRISDESEPFEDYIESVRLVYDFKGPDDRPIRLITDKNRILLPIVTVLSFYEFLKFVYNGVFDNNLHRLYLCDLVGFL